MTFRTAAIAFAIASGAAAAAHAQTASHDPAAVKPGTYAVEPAHTQIEFAVSHMGFTTYYGRFSGASGTLTLAPDVTGSTLSVTVPVASVSTTSAKLDDELRSPAWFDAQRFPEARFVSTRVTRTGAGSARVDGALTLHGVTRPATLQVRFEGAGINPLDKAYTVGFEATAAISRSAFGVKTYVPLIGDDVTLHLSGAFERRG